VPTNTKNVSSNPAQSRKFDRHDLAGQMKPDGTLVGSCILNWNGVGVQVLRNYSLLVVGGGGGGGGG
jgi:hypothetical protein